MWVWQQALNPHTADPQLVYLLLKGTTVWVWQQSLNPHTAGTQLVYHTRKSTTVWVWRVSEGLDQWDSDSYTCASILSVLRRISVRTVPVLPEVVTLVKLCLFHTSTCLFVRYSCVFALIQPYWLNGREISIYLPFICGTHMFLKMASTTT